MKCVNCDYEVPPYVYNEDDGLDYEDNGGVFGNFYTSRPRLRMTRGRWEGEVRVAETVTIYGCPSCGAVFINGSQKAKNKEAREE